MSLSSSLPHFPLFWLYSQIPARDLWQLQAHTILTASESKGTKEPLFPVLLGKVLKLALVD